MQGKLVDQVAGVYRTDSNATFLSLNMDQDRSGVPAFLKQQGWTLPVAYAQGLDQLLSVRALPTLVIFDRQGRDGLIAQDGVDPGSFVEDLSKHLRETLGEPSPGPAPPSEIEYQEFGSSLGEAVAAARREFKVDSALQTFNSQLSTSVAISASRLRSGTKRAQHSGITRPVFRG